MHPTRSRRFKVVAILFFACILVLASAWRRTDRGSSTERQPYVHQSPSVSPLPFTDVFITDPPPTSRGPSKQRDSTPKHVKEYKASLHLLIPNSEHDGHFCKTLLSSFLLNYPPPTITDYGKAPTGDGEDKAAHGRKIQGVYDFLSKDKKVRDEDLVLIIDGSDVWFQLPPEVLVKRYHNVIRDANQRLKQRYGTVVRQKPWEALSRRWVPTYVQTVMFASDKLCWPNPADSPACASLPPSTLPPDAYGPETDKDPDGFKNRPRFLNAGTIIGPVSDVRAVYERALEKVERGGGARGEQSVFAEILGEQEEQREAFRQTSRGRLQRWLEQYLSVLGTSSSTPVKSLVKETTAYPDHRYDRYEFSIGLDYTSSVVQTLTHSTSDVSFLTHNSTHPLPNDVLTARPPIPGPYEPTYLAASSLPPFSTNLDLEPGCFEKETWLTLPLATNTITHTIPALIHVNGDRSYLQEWWPKMWLQPYARALLRAYMRTPQPMLWGVKGRRQRTWDRRGGRGGVWTTKATWIGWDEICKGVEDEVFMDGKGVWMKEEGDGKIFNEWGTQITGEKDTPAGKNESTERGESLEKSEPAEKDSSTEEKET
ncbi:MAG: hypothetical protein Q9187_001802 [Circinaria calcarea]